MLSELTHAAPTSRGGRAAFSVGGYVDRLKVSKSTESAFILRPVRERRGGRPERIGDDGRRFSQRRHPVKVVYDTLGEASLNAFKIFALQGVVLTPYRCIERRYVAGCERWHLTSNLAMLPP